MMHLLPPRSTLFPYTTLFRSDWEQHAGDVADEREGIGALSSTFLPFFKLISGKFPLDRKSTRLNSSHTVISYAVFCLKKKTGDRLSRSLDTQAITYAYGGLGA